MTKSEEGFELEPPATNNVWKRLARGVLVIAGTFFVALGLVGILVPLLPTTPFLLLAAACYARGSKKFHSWLLGNRLFGKYVRNYLEGRGVPVKTKALLIMLLWLIIGFSAISIVPVLIWRIVLVVIAAVVTVHVLSIKTLR